MSSGEAKVGFLFVRFLGFLLLLLLLFVFLRTFYFGKENEHRGWQDGLAVKSTYYSCGGSRPSSKHLCLMAHNHL